MRIFVHIHYAYTFIYVYYLYMLIHLRKYCHCNYLLNVATCCKCLEQSKHVSVSASISTFDNLRGQAISTRRMKSYAP